MAQYDAYRTELTANEKRGRLIIGYVVSALLVLFAVILLGRLIVNAAFVSAHRAGRDLSGPEKLLLYPNVTDPYVALNNLGVAAYERGDYDEAISYFSRALQSNPPHHVAEEGETDDIACDIRVNYALALLAKIDFSDLESEEKVERVVQMLLQAREVLTQDGCANPEKGVYDGHNPEAEQLKKEIDEILEQLMPPQDGGSDGEDSESESEPQEENEDSGAGGQSDREQQLQQQLENQQREAQQMHNDAEREQQAAQEGSGGGGDTEGEAEGQGFDGRIW